MPFGTPSRVNVTFVESDDCSKVVVNVAKCSGTIEIQMLLRQYKGRKISDLMAM
jgi:hypothetical protein